MYAKIFTSIYDGTLGGDWKALVTFQQLLVLCDKQGVVDMTGRSIAARTGIPLDVIEPGIVSLEQPDPDSRTPDFEGRRIERIDDHRAWGWRIVNYAKYRELMNAEQKRAADRERIAAKRAGQRDMSQPVAECRDTSQEVANVAQVEVEADVLGKPRVRGAPELHQHVIALYHELLPSLPAVKLWSDRRRRKLDARIRETLKRGKPADTIDWWQKFFEHVAASDFLTGRTTNWRCPGLEWLLEPRQFEKVIEGAYENHTNGARR